MRIQPEIYKGIDGILICKCCGDCCLDRECTRFDWINENWKQIPDELFEYEGNCICDQCYSDEGVFYEEYRRMDYEEERNWLLQQTS